MISRRFVSIAHGRAFSAASRALKKVAPPSLSEISVVDLEKYGQAMSPQEEFAKDLAECSEEDTRESKIPRNSLIKSVLYGSSQAQQEAAQLDKSFSMQLMRGKLVHEITFHKVAPGNSQAYVELVTEQNQLPESNSPVRLVGAWRAIIGSDIDTYVHIWEYDSLAQLHHAKSEAHKSAQHQQFTEKLRPLLRSRSSEILEEFAFWGGTAEPRALGGIFELRQYDLRPGTMVDWEFYWRKGIESRREVMEPVGAWFTGIGPLNRVYHLWQFTDLHQRKISRQRSWEQPGWAETTQETVKLLDRMESLILLPLDYSPLR